MIDLLTSNPLAFVIAAVSLVVALGIHEFAHAYAADKLGDPTPRLMGRLTLNPLKHLDPLGTFLLLFIGFGWGKPVLFDPYNLKNPRKDSAVIALAGPFSNLILASITSLVLRFVPAESLSLLYPALTAFLYYNVVLAIFNLLPMHPLDGGKILVGLLPRQLAHEADRFMQAYGTFILIIMILPVFGGGNLVSTIISPIIRFLMGVYLPQSQFI